MSKIFKKVQVWIALGLPEERKKILLFKVIPERGQGWHPVTGSVEGRESLLSAAKRETAEETGLRVNLKKCKWYDLNYSFEFEGRWGKCAENGFGLWICQSNALLKKEEYPTITLDPREHLKFKWVSVSDAKKTIQYPHQKKVLNLFYEKLRNPSRS